MKTIADIRQDYKMNELSEADVDKNPMLQFDQWWAEAIQSNITEVNAMTLATVGSNGMPSARMVLLKGVATDGFIFYSNYASSKAADMQLNPHVALVIFWKELERQIRIEGKVAMLPDAQSDTYFLSRPVDSQIGAWASPQSSTIASRAVLDENLNMVKLQFANSPIIRPPFWGGYLVKPSKIEFWQGRSNRLHDRLLYEKIGADWALKRLAP